MSLRLRRAPARAIAWGLFALLCAVDATIASPIALGLLYFVPLALASQWLQRREALALALACGAAAILLGPTGDPLGLGELTLHVQRGLVAPLAAGVGLLAYVSVALLISLGSEQRRRAEAPELELEADPLTGLANGRGLQRFLSARLASGEAVSVLDLDLDAFGPFNEAHGHDAADRALRELSLRLLHELRGGDLVARTGGEEFVVVLPGLDAATTLLVAERICRAVRDRPFDVVAGRASLTVSIGAATGEATQALLTAAGGALRAAKAAGRDRVQVARPADAVSSDRREA